ncbi:MAG: T9SS type A sorting domain-containing protein [Bacteroidota bacterium]
MKRNLLLLLLLLSATPLFSQNNNTNTEESGVIYCTDFRVTRPVRDIVAENPVDENAIKEEVQKKNAKKLESPDRKNRKPQTFVYSAEKDGPAYGTDPSIVQTTMGTRTIDQEKGGGMKLNQQGQNTGSLPHDPSGAAGTTYYVQAVNATPVRVYNKTSGATVQSFTMGNLWSPATGNMGDPIVMYDRFADRWFLAQFGQSGGQNRIYIAISQTNDPTGSYYTYTFTSPQFPDYLKFGIWHDGYYMTCNTGTKRVFCFERTAMLAGSPTARSVYQSFTAQTGGGFFCPLPADADGNGGLPTSGPCPIFYYTDNAWGGGAIDGIRRHDVSVVWSATPTMTITAGATIATNAFDGSYDPNWDDISQPGTAQKLDGIGGVLQFRAQWRKWSGYNSVVLTWPVRLSATQRSMMWCELRQNQSTGVWSVYQQGVYAPDNYYRWVGSISMDDNGNIALCYAKSGASTVYPSLGWTGRLSTDPLNTMTFAETIAINGTSYQTSINRFGDYAHTCLDPDGMTFWHTGQYNGGANGTGAGRTRIYSFQLQSVLVAGVTIAQTSGTNPMCAGSSATFTATPTNGGSAPSYQWKVNGVNVGTNSPTYTTTTLANGDVVTCVMTSNLSGVTGNPATSNAITMTVNPVVTPAVSIAITSGSNPTCAGSSVTFTATPTNGGTPSYQWKKNGVNVGTNSATYTTTTLANADVITVVMTSTAACASPATATSNAITMTVNPSVAPTISVALTSGTNPMCAGASATFTATITNGGASPVYQWQKNGVNVGTNSSTYTTTTLVNGDVITCQLTSNATCAVPASVTSSGITMTVNPIVTPSVVITGTNPACTGQTATFTATPTNGGSSPSYQWQVNGANVGTNSSTYSSTTLVTGDVVTCILTSNASCTTASTANSNSITMTVNSIPATPVITQNGSVLTSSASSGNQWYLNGVLISGATGTSYTATQDGTYTVVVTVNGCSSSASNSINVSGTGVDELGNPNTLTIFPNPNDGNFTITFYSESKENFKLELFNDIGQLVYTETMAGVQGSFSKNITLGKFATGVYTLVLSDSKNESVRKVVVR